MKILVLSKRQYMGKDLLDDRFGRFRELPLELARRGHQVEGLVLSYRPRRETEIEDISADGGARVKWRSVNLANGLQFGLSAYFQQARSLLSTFQPEIIWACSDALHAIVGARFAQTARAKCVIDLYDNFEAFGATKVPGVRRRFRQAVRQADGVTCFSQRLADYIISAYPLNQPVAVIESAVAPDVFYPRDRTWCREQLGLPLEARILGTAGALHRSRDIESLFRAYEMLSTHDDNLHLAVAGPRQTGLRIPTEPRVHDFQQLPQTKVPLLIGSLDVAVVSYKNSAQGRFSFPQKLYEMLACKVPIIAAAVGSAQDVLRNNPSCLFEPEDPSSLAAAVRRQLQAPQIADVATPSWQESAGRLEHVFTALLRQNLAASNPTAELSL